MTLGHFAPQGATGVADYAVALHRALAAQGPIRWNDATASISLYHVGNNQLHRPILERALRYPGVTILHDAVLHHLYLGLDEESYINEFVYNYGEWGRGMARWFWRQRALSAADPVFYEYGMLRRLAESSRLVMVHNRRAESLVRRAAPKAGVAVIPHLVEIPPARPPEFHSGVWFGVFGYLRPAKRVSAVVDVVARMPAARLLIAGEPADGASRPPTAALARQERIQWLPLADKAEFERRLHAVDVVVSLRQPSAGETSGITLRAMAAGKPVLVHSPGEADDFPEGLCVPVATGVAERASLEAAMHWMTQSAADRAAVGAAAKAHVAREHAPDAIACRLWSLLRTLSAMAILCVSGTASPPAQMVEVPMRDGIRLRAHLYRPATAERLPVLLLRTPYGGTETLSPNQAALAASGYALLLENVRGRYGSPGKFDPLQQEFDDAEDTLRWIDQQPWSNGRVGMFGGSYSGLAQWKAAATGAPNLRALFPVHAGIDEYFDRYYSRGGALRLGHRTMWLAQNLRAPGYPVLRFDQYIWRLPLRTIDAAATGQPLRIWQSVLDHPSYYGFWKQISVRERLDLARSPPAFLVSGWYDPNVEGDLEWFSRLAGGGGVHRIVVGPWAHNMSAPFSGVDFGPAARYPVLKAQRQWFGYFLKGDRELPPGGPVSLSIMGLNLWRDEPAWPLARAIPTKFHLARGRRLRSAPGPEWKETWQYDPRNPTPTHGGATCCDPAIFPWGPFDQRKIERRPDVLTFLSAPLNADLEVTGPVRAVLHVQTSAPDTDFTVKLVDVFPSGEARLLCDGILRLRYRNGLQQPRLSTPGEIHTITVEAGVTSNLFRSGHRIGVEIASSNFPKYDRNPNTGRAIADERELRVATQSLWMGGQRPSYLLLPVIPQTARLSAGGGRRSWHNVISWRNPAR